MVTYSCEKKVNTHDRNDLLFRINDSYGNRWIDGEKDKENLRFFRMNKVQG